MSHLRALWKRVTYRYDRNLSNCPAGIRCATRHSKSNSWVFLVLLSSLLINVTHAYAWGTRGDVNAQSHLHMTVNLSQTPSWTSTAHNLATVLSHTPHQPADPSKVGQYRSDISVRFSLEAGRGPRERTRFHSLDVFIRITGAERPETNCCVSEYVQNQVWKRKRRWIWIYKYIL